MAEMGWPTSSWFSTNVGEGSSAQGRRDRWTFSQAAASCSTNGYGFQATP